MHVAATSYFPRESPGRKLAAGSLASSREQESRALWLESQQPASSIFCTAVACFFSVVGQRLQR